MQKIAGSLQEKEKTTGALSQEKLKAEELIKNIQNQIALLSTDKAALADQFNKEKFALQ